MPNGTLIDCGEGFRLNIKLDVLKNVSQKGWWRQKVDEKVRKIQKVGRLLGSQWHFKRAMLVVRTPADRRGLWVDTRVAVQKPSRQAPECLHRLKISQKGLSGQPLNCADRR